MSGSTVGGEAQLEFAALLTSDAREYNAIKGAIPARYDINKKAYRYQFWMVTRKDGETNHAFSDRLIDLVKNGSRRGND